MLTITVGFYLSGLQQCTVRHSTSPGRNRNLPPRHVSSRPIGGRSADDDFLADRQQVVLADKSGCPATAGNANQLVGIDDIPDICLAVIVKVHLDLLPGRLQCSHGRHIVEVVGIIGSSVVERRTVPRNVCIFVGGLHGLRAVIIQILRINLFLQSLVIDFPVHLLLVHIAQTESVCILITVGVG